MTLLRQRSSSRMRSGSAATMKDDKHENRADASTDVDDTNTSAPPLPDAVAVELGVNEVNAENSFDYYSCSTPSSSMNASSAAAPAGCSSDDDNAQMRQTEMQVLYRVQKRQQCDKANTKFRERIKLALIVATGVIVTRFLTLHRGPDTMLLKVMPDWYYLGGLLTNVMAAYSVERTIGASLQKICHVSMGICLAVVYTIIVFFAIPHVDQDPARLFKTSLTGPKLHGNGSVTEVYYVNVKNLLIFWPFIIAFCFAVLIMPVPFLTEKLALKIIVVVAMLVLNPMDFEDPTKLRATDDGTFDLHLRNIGLFGAFGIVGLWVTFVLLLLLYPRFALKQLAMEMKESSEALNQLFRVLIKTHCFRQNHVHDMEFVHIHISRQRREAGEHLRQLQVLVNSAWYERLFGLEVVFGIEYDQAKVFENEYRAIWKQTCVLLIEMEKCDAFHLQIMKNLQQDVERIQVTTCHMFTRASQVAINKTSSQNNNQDETQIVKLESQCHEVHKQLEELMQKAAQLSIKLGLDRFTYPSQVDNAMTTLLFLYMFHMYVDRVCRYVRSVCDHKQNSNNGSHDNEDPSTSRLARFQHNLTKQLHNSLGFLFQRGTYSKLNLIFATRTSISTVLGLLLACFTLRFNTRIPSTIALVAQNRVGGTYTSIVIRIGALLIGCAIPSIAQYYVCAFVPHDYYLVDIAANVVLFLMMTLVMYIGYGESMLTPIGRLVPFLPIFVMVNFMNTSCPVVLPDNLIVVTYDVFSQTLVALGIIFVVDLLFLPTSARTLLRHNVHDTLQQSHQAFESLFKHHLAIERQDYDRLSHDQVSEIRNSVNVKIPAMIQQQVMLINDATLEPALWWPSFNRQKYHATTDLCQELNDTIWLLLRCCDWKQWQIDSLRSVDLALDGNIMASDCRESDSMLETTSQQHIREVLTQWRSSQDDLLRTIHGTLDTVWSIYKQGIGFENAAKSGAYMQLKEAFRLADVTHRMKLNEQELTKVFAMMVPNLRQYLRRRNKLAILPKDDLNDMTKAECQQLAKEVMEQADVDRDGLLDFHEFIRVIQENSFRFHLSRSQRNKDDDTADSQTELEEDDDEDDQEVEMVPLLDEDFLCVESYSIKEAAANFKRLYCELVMLVKDCPGQDKRLLVREMAWMSCLICTTDQLALKLTRLNTVSVS